MFYFFSTTSSRGFRLDSSSSIDTRENSPVRLTQRLTPQPRQMDYHQYTSSRTTPTYPAYTSTSGTNYFNTINTTHSDQYYTDSYGRSTINPATPLFRTATITTNSPPTPIATARVKPSSYRPSTINGTYDTPRSYQSTLASGYVSDTNDLRRSSISLRPLNASGTTSSLRQTTYQQPYATSSNTATYNTQYSAGSDQNYFSDSEYVSSGPRYYKIARQFNTSRRPSNIVLPIRSVTSKAYDQYIPPEIPTPQQQIFDVYRQQQEQRERERQEHLQRQLYQQQQQQQQQQKQQKATTARFNPPPRLNLPSETNINHEIGAELFKSPIANSMFL